MKIALCQMNPTVGDLAGNAAKIEAFADQAAKAGAVIALFPELALTGYPPRDLLLKNAFIADQTRVLGDLAARITGITAVVGAVARGDGERRALHNSAVRHSPNVS